jgi:hypothetical protein
MYNMTLIGSTPDAGQAFVLTSAAGQPRIQFRNGFAGGPQLDRRQHRRGDGHRGAARALASAYRQRRAGLLSLVCSTLDDGAALAADEITVVNNGNALNLALGGTAAGANATTGAFTGLTVEDQSFNPTGNAAGKLDASLKALKINPRPAGGLTGVSGCTSPRGPGLDPGATYAVRSWARHRSCGLRLTSLNVGARQLIRALSNLHLNTRERKTQHNEASISALFDLDRGRRCVRLGPRSSDDGRRLGFLAVPQRQPVERGRRGLHGHVECQLLESGPDLRCRRRVHLFRNASSSTEAFGSTNVAPVPVPRRSSDRGLAHLEHHARARFRSTRTSPGRRGSDLRELPRYDDSRDIARPSSRPTGHPAAERQ